MNYSYIELKADDVMPWGKYKGISLRAIYKKDISFYRTLCSRKDSYGISETTKRIIERDLPIPIALFSEQKRIVAKLEGIPPV